LHAFLKLEHRRDFAFFQVEMLARPGFDHSMMMPGTPSSSHPHAVPMSTGLAVALKVLPAPSPFFELVLGVFEVGVRNRNHVLIPP